MAFSAASLMDRACEEVELQDYGPAPLREPLERFCQSLNREAGLSGPAAASAEDMILSTLAERLRLQSWFARHPEILDQRITAPLNVIGLPRSGTTALSQFLSEDPAMRSIRRWELSTPTPPPDETQAEDPRIAATRAAFERRDAAMPAFRTMLPVTESDPSEHNAPMNFTFMNLQLPSLYDVPSFGEWLQQRQEIDGAVAGHGKDPLHHRRHETHVLAPRPFQHSRADVLAMEMHDAVEMPVQKRSRVAARK